MHQEKLLPAGGTAIAGLLFRHLWFSAQWFQEVGIGERGVAGCGLLLLA
jgi:hypothetical protein